MMRQNAKQLGILPKKQLAITETAPESTGLAPDSSLAPGGSSVQRVNELLRAFSDVSSSFEDEEHSWESWNYARLSTF